MPSRRVSSLQRAAAAPNVPTVAESGVAGTAGFEAVAWQSIVAPAGTPKAVIDDYSQKIARIMADPALRQKLEADGVEVDSSTPEQLAAYIRTETARWGKVIRASGATVD